LLFGMVQFRDGPFRRPHPAFWRIVLGLNLLYFMCLLYLFFQTKEQAREILAAIDPSLGKSLPEKSYAENCEFTPKNDQIDIFCLAHALGWFGKALILRDYWFCWILSVMFEVMEYSLEHQLPNFAECWGDHWLLDVLICNWAGIALGMKCCEYFRVTPFSWRGLRTTSLKRGFRARTTRAVKQFTPYDWTEFNWEGTRRFRNYISTVMLLSIFLLSELNVFYLKALLWMAPEHWIVITRLAFIFLWALPAVRELYQYVSMGKKVVRMGSHAWLLYATVILELLCVIKWSTGEFPDPAPLSVKVFWTVFLSLLVLYPSVKFGYPAWKRRLDKRESSPRPPAHVEKSE